MSEYKKLIDSLSYPPLTNIIHFPLNDDSLYKEILNIDELADYNVIFFDENNYQKFSGKNKRLLTKSAKRYNQNQRLYDYAFIEADIEDRELFLDKLYNVLKNGANLFIFNPQKSELDLWEELLYKHNYVAVNSFSLGKIDIISAKKMHGWK
ncbi:MAG: hypothetical protein GXO02_04515 [Epsilonproteobacteria bacterium]|nr:hypothetical protein [Campylobacterota bacterium]